MRLSLLFETLLSILTRNKNETKYFCDLHESMCTDTTSGIMHVMLLLYWNAKVRSRFSLGTRISYSWWSCATYGAFVYDEDDEETFVS